MKILFEEYAYDRADVEKFIGSLEGCVPLKLDRVMLPYVGYYYSPAIDDCVFILPKVFIKLSLGDDEKEGKAFGLFAPRDIIDTQEEGNPLLNTNYGNEIFNLSVWIYRAIAKFNSKNEKENITLDVKAQNIISAGGENDQTLIDIVNSLIRFNHEHRNLFTFISKINNQGNRKISWSKTIRREIPVIQDDVPIYLQFQNKKKAINFDEELIVLFYSVLEYLHDKYNFKIQHDLNYETDARAVAKLIESGKGTRLLKSIRKKYFKDELVALWKLIYVFFDRSQKIKANRYHEEKMLARNFNIIFEDMIDDLVGDSTKQKSPILKDQPDGKFVDHIYAYDSLIHDYSRSIYYIGDSKYYKEGNTIGDKSIYKQFTYARNVIYFNMVADGDDNLLGRNSYYDAETEGYNVTPNFFIRGKVNLNSDQKLNYTSNEIAPVKDTNGENVVESQMHHINRLFDRDTLYVLTYDINFLFVMSSYISNHHNESFRRKVYNQFRVDFLNHLAQEYDFFILIPIHQEALEKNFHKLLGKIFSLKDRNYLMGLKKFEQNQEILLNNIINDFEIYYYDIKEKKIKSRYG